MVRWRKSEKSDEPSSEPSATTSGAQATAERPAEEKPAEQPAEQPAKQPAEQPAAEEKPAAKQPAAKPAPTKAAPAAKRTEEKKPSKGKQAGEMVVAGTNALRSRIASLIWLVAVVCALVLAVGALLVALKMNRDNAIVAFFIDAAKTLDFGSFKDFTGPGHVVKEALVNWGIAAVIYLVVGKVLDRVIRP